jgi:phospholipid:diacylglycerol acyltransferase
MCGWMAVWVFADDNITADHVDILGRMSLNELILQVAGGRGELIQDTIHSNIREYAEKVKIYEEED